MKRWLEPLTRFLQIESASGIVLLVAAVNATLVANSAWGERFLGFWHIKAGLTLEQWVNDGLMSLFFFVIGLEIKRELVFGELNTRAKAMLPAVAALGGMVVPALVYFAILRGQRSAAGWGIPMATDIAFAITFLMLLGNRVPNALKVLLLALAIVDDIGATLIIALVYTQRLNWWMLAGGIAGFALVAMLWRFGFRRIAVFLPAAAAIWLCFYGSGVHPTVAGVTLGLMTPAGARADRWERRLHPWVAFLIMPIFALANAGVVVHFAGIREPVTLAVAAGLVIGKPVGIVLACAAAIALRLAQLPDGVNFRSLIGVGCLAGIGFTMSLFIAHLALDDHEQTQAKLGIIVGSATSAILGCGLLWLFLPRPKPHHE